MPRLKIVLSKQSKPAWPSWQLPLAHSPSLMPPRPRERLCQPDLAFPIDSKLTNSHIYFLGLSIYPMRENKSVGFLCQGFVRQKPTPRAAFPENARAWKVHICTRRSGKLRTTTTSVARSAGGNAFLNRSCKGRSNTRSIMQLDVWWFRLHFC